MSSISISGYGDDLSVNGIRIGDLTPAEHEKIEKEMGGQNYAPLENVVVSMVKDSSTLMARKPDPDDVGKYIETELIDGLCCYCLLYTSPSPRDRTRSRMPSSA